MCDDCAVALEEPEQHGGVCSARVRHDDAGVEERRARAFGQVACQRCDVTRMGIGLVLLQVRAAVAVGIACGAIDAGRGVRIQTVPAFPDVGKPVFVGVQQREIEHAH